MPEKFLLDYIHFSKAVDANNVAFRAHGIDVAYLASYFSKLYHEAFEIGFTVEPLDSVII